MDRIEPADGSRGPPDPEQGAELHSLRPTSYTRNRTLSRSRRPSIRIQRRPSASSAEGSNRLPEPQPGSHDRRSVGATQALEAQEEEEYQSSRRRSNSEPRPGRWSAPNPVVLSRVTTRDYRAPMFPLTEEAPQSPIATSPTQGTDAHLLAPPPAVPRGDSSNIWRRTSEAALSRFSRNRASTVSGASPELPRDRASEYDPRMVDVLDVIGKSLLYINCF